MRDAAHHQAAMIMAKAPASAAALNAPRPAARPAMITCRFTIGQRLDRTFELGLSRVTNDHPPWVHFVPSRTLRTRCPFAWGRLDPFPAPIGNQRAQTGVRLSTFS